MRRGEGRPGKSRPARARSLWRSAVGATIEWYDFFLYGTAAGLVFDELYFNGLDGPTAQFAAFATFAVGFLARPVGGLIFGHFGDRIGRKQMLILTLLIMGIGTAAIGLLPTYDQIGVGRRSPWSSCGSCRASASAVSTAERCCSPSSTHRPSGAASSAASRTSACPGGLLLAAGAFSVAGLLPDEAFLAWGWRACFLISIAAARDRRLHPALRDGDPVLRQGPGEEADLVHPAEGPGRAASRSALLLGMGTRFIEGFTFNLFSVFLLAYVVTNMGLPKQWALNGIMVGAAIGVVLVPIAGALSDRVVQSSPSKTPVRSIARQTFAFRCRMTAGV